MEWQQRNGFWSRRYNYVLQQNYTTGPASRDIDWPFDAIENVARGVVERRLSFSPLSFSFTRDGNDMHLISHLDNRAIVSRANDLRDLIWRRLGRNGNELFNSLLTRLSYYRVWYFRYHVLPKLQWYSRTRELLLTYQINWNSYRIQPIRTLMYAFIIYIL